MAIRFLCGSCSQPIEVDDEWVLKTVACPYCRKTVTAPPESTLEDPGQVPMASPLAVNVPAPAPAPAPYHAVSSTNDRNRIALVALILACCSIGLLLVSQLILASHRLELEEFQEAMRGAKSLTESLEAQTAFFDSHPDALSWLIPAMILVIASGLTAVASVVCGVVGMRRPRRRRLAAAALAISGLIPIFFCCGGMIFGPG